MRDKKVSFLLLLIIVFICFTPTLSFAAGKEDDIYQKRLALYKKTEAVTNIPWYYLAAIDQYERNILSNQEEEKIISIAIPDEVWFGIGNITLNPKEEIVKFFDGIGRDGNGDGFSNPQNDEDVLYTMANYLASFGLAKEDIKIGLFRFYKRDLSVKTIMNTARIFKKFQTLQLDEREFPVATEHNYSYKNNWGDRRGYGGLRIHEGTDIFADYGTPVKATTYGVVEIKGWNRFGGWRIGIRDIFNVYHYYAHLNSYDDKIEVGQIVQPGDVLGSVGSSGYGPPGTAGKFPPHLHYGMYKDNGYKEWSFDPYPYLRRWEQISKQNK